MDGSGEGTGRARSDDPGPAAGSLAGWRALGQEGLEAEAGIPIPAIGIEDPERRPPTGRTGSAARDDDLGGLPDDIAAQPDPGPTGQLQADPRPLSDRSGH